MMVPLVILHHVQELQKVWSQVVILLYKENWSCVVLHSNHLVKYLVSLPPPVMLCLRIFWLSKVMY